MTDKHTPGPWTVTELDPAPEPGFAYAVGRDPGPADVPWPIALTVIPADARLIAAAPALLSALEKVAHDADESLMQRPGDLPAILAVTYKQARAAIKQAKGD